VGIKPIVELKLSGRKPQLASTGNKTTSDKLLDG
jgi:hypothetical protein